MIHVCNILTSEKMLSAKLSQYHIYKLEATVGGCYFYSQRFDLESGLPHGLNRVILLFSQT